MKTFIYVISGDHGRQKIGITDSPRARIKNLQTGSAYPLKFEFLGETDDNAAGSIEVEAHFTLSQHRVSGEWFVVPPDVAVTAVMAAAHRLGYRLRPVDPDTARARGQAVVGTTPAWSNWTAFAISWVIGFGVIVKTDHVLTGLIVGVVVALIATRAMRHIAGFVEAAREAFLTAPSSVDRT
jgi:Meiotically up-regulated gene 113